jgi:hypothetical protein
MLLICETCHRRFERGKVRQKTCPKCHRARLSLAAKARERLKRTSRRMAAQIASQPAGEASVPARPITADELRALMAEADAAGARALAAALAIRKPDPG